MTFLEPLAALVDLVPYNSPLFYVDAEIIVGSPVIFGVGGIT